MPQAKWVWIIPTRVCVLSEVYCHWAGDESVDNATIVNTLRVLYLLFLGEMKCDCTWLLHCSPRTRNPSVLFRRALTCSRSTTME